MLSPDAALNLNFIISYYFLCQDISGQSQKAHSDQIHFEDDGRKIASARRGHKSFIVNLEKIASLRNREIKIGEKEIPVGEAILEELMFYLT